MKPHPTTPSSLSKPSGGASTAKEKMAKVQAQVVANINQAGQKAAAWEAAARIENLAGVELNRLVAEQIMGWTELREIGQTGVLFGLHPRWGNCRMQVPGYSEIAVAAADVAKAMLERQFEFTLTRMQQPPAAGGKTWYETTFTLRTEGKADPAAALGSCRHEEETVAICRAALLALLGHAMPKR